MKKYICLLFTALLCSCGGGEEPDEPGGGGEEPEVPVVSDRLKIMSFNVRNQKSTDTGTKHWESRKMGVKVMISEIQPDVIALQESSALHRTWFRNSYRDSYGFRDVPETLTAGGSGGNTCIMYRMDRFELVESGGYFLSETPDEPSLSFGVPDNLWRTSVWLHLKEKGTGKEFYVMSTHLPVRSDSSADNTPYIAARTKSAQLNVERMKEIAGENGMCFIGGDMNCAYKTSSGAADAGGAQVLAKYTEWMTDGRLFNDLTPSGVHSYQSFGNASPGPHRDIDHIFYRKAEPVQFETISQPFGGVDYISDHYPVMLTVKF